MGALRIGAVTDGVLTVELDRAPENLLTMHLCRELTEVMLNPPPDAHILRLRGAGDTFCMGRERAGSSVSELREESAILVGLHRAIRRSSIVSVAEVNGDAAGFGVGLIAACDVAVMVESARLSFPEVEIGLAPSLVLAWLPRIVGDRQAFWLTASGEPLTAKRAEQLGIVNSVAATREDLAAEVDARVATLRKHKPRVHLEIRSMLETTQTMTEDQALELSIDRLVVGALRRNDK